MTVTLPGAARTVGYPPQGPVRVLHLDAHLIAVDKPAGLLTVPGKAPELADCLLLRVALAWPGALLLHRLDRDTSGVTLFARSRAAQRHVARQFQRRAVAKRYVALAAGWPAARGNVELPLAADWPNRPRQRVDHAGGRAAQTRWERLGPVPGGARLALFPVTGRSHQLRVHLAALGHPILGDPLYDGPPAPRLMLHAERLALRHPSGGAPLELVAPCPF